MLAKQEATLRALRAVKSALLLARTEKGASDVLTEETEIKVLQKLIKQRKESAEIYKTQNRDDLYQIEVEELQVIEIYLPQQMERADVETYIKQLIASLGVTSVKEMGKVMAPPTKNWPAKPMAKPYPKW